MHSRHRSEAAWKAAAHDAPLKAAPWMRLNADPDADGGAMKAKIEAGVGAAKQCAIAAGVGRNPGREVDAHMMVGLQRRWTDVLKHSEEPQCRSGQQQGWMKCW